MREGLRLQRNIALRYCLAIALTSALMAWQSASVMRSFENAREHMTFWIISVTAGWLQMILISRGVRATFGPERVPGWALLLISALVGAVPLTFEVRWLMETIVAPEQGLLPPWRTYINVAVINAVFCVVQFVLIERWPLLSTKSATDTEVGSAPMSEENAHDAEPTRPAVRMLRRPPEDLAGYILYLRIEDHYLRVTTTEGSGLALYRMSDAVEDLKMTDGVQVHRSWWVSKSAIEHIDRSNRKVSLIMADGERIPVGRSYEKALRQSKWI